MTKEALLAKGGIYFEKIQNGMAEYTWESRYLSSRSAEKYIRQLWEKNGPENSFVDCYYPFLEKESQEMVLEMLSPRQQEYLKKLDMKADDVAIPLDEEILSIATILNDRELLFFTFYFTGELCTIWGNYKQEYVIFTPNKEK